MTEFILQSCSNSTQTPNIKLLKYEHDNKIHVWLSSLLPESMLSLTEEAEIIHSVYRVLYMTLQCDQKKKKPDIVTSYFLTTTEIV